MLIEFKAKTWYFTHNLPGMYSLVNKTMMLHSITLSGVLLINKINKINDSDNTWWEYIILNISKIILVYV